MDIRRAGQAALIGGLIAGALDILAAFVINHAVGPAVVLKAVASGLLGRAAYGGGAEVAALGLAVHFALSIGFAAVFVAVAIRMRSLLHRPLAAGVIYGGLVYLAMNFVFVPLSAAVLGDPPMIRRLMDIAAHTLLFGPAVALVAARRLG